MFAVIKTGGRQYRVGPDDVLEIGKIAGDVGTIVQLGEVLFGRRRAAGAWRAHGCRRLGCGRSAAAQARPEGHLVQEAPPQEFAAASAAIATRSRCLRITEILTNDNEPTIGPRPKREKPVVAAPVDGDDEAPSRSARKKAPAKKAVARKTAKPRARPDARKAPARKAAAKSKK